MEMNWNEEEGQTIFDKVQSITGQVGNRFSILEEKIDIKLQMQYFRFSKKVKLDLNPEEILMRIPDLYNPEILLDEKKRLLAQLASIEEVEAYRAIEKYIREAMPELREWAVLALQESRMMLESALLEENQVFISTGLGGKGTKLRYFVVLISNNNQIFNEYQKKIIQSEFDTVLRKYNGEMEEVIFSDRFSSLFALVPLEAPVQEVFKQALEECNQFGGFLKQNFLITNVKSLSPDEIGKFIDHEGNFHPEPPAIE